jgi:hypothetical protein
MLELHLDLSESYPVVNDYAGVEACAFHVAVSDALFYLCPRLVDHRGSDLHLWLRELSDRDTDISATSCKPHFVSGS